MISHMQPSRLDACPTILYTVGPYFPPY